MYLFSLDKFIIRDEVTPGNWSDIKVQFEGLDARSQNRVGQVEAKVYWI